MITASRTHEFCYGHRVYGHEGKCAKLHGHNAKVVFTVGSDTQSLDWVGRVIDFSVIKNLLCDWLEENWDHKTLLWEHDPLVNQLAGHDRYELGIVVVPFNPTAEQLAQYLVNIVGPRMLPSDVRLLSVKFWETSKCYATATYEPPAIDPILSAIQDNQVIIDSINRRLKDCK